jgi:hypothetical protein
MVSALLVDSMLVVYTNGFIFISRLTDLKNIDPASKEQQIVRQESAPINIAEN